MMAVLSRSLRARCSSASSTSTRNRTGFRSSPPSWNFTSSSAIPTRTIHLEPPIGRSGRPEAGRRSYSISAVNEFDDLFEDIYAFAEAQQLEVDTLIHEEGAAQMEINLRHGDPLALCDQVFLLKRTIREAALKHDIYATFMAKPIANEPGSAMHIHQSVLSAMTGRNIFTDDEDRPTPEFFNFLAGQQQYVPAVTCMLAPYVNSYRRLVKGASAPVNVLWGYDNRTTGLRIPPSSPANRRVENRAPSSTPIPISPSPHRLRAAISA